MKHDLARLDSEKPLLENDPLDQHIEFLHLRVHLVEGLLWIILLLLIVLA